MISKLFSGLVEKFSMNKEPFFLESGQERIIVLPRDIKKFTKIARGIYYYNTYGDHEKKIWHRENAYTCITEIHPEMEERRLVTCYHGSLIDNLVRPKNMIKEVLHDVYDVPRKN